MTNENRPGRFAPLRIGAVNYLNSKPLIEGLAELAPEAELDSPGDSGEGAPAVGLVGLRIDGASVSTMSYTKRIEVTLKAFGMVTQRHPEARLAVVGAAAYDQACADRAVPRPGHIHAG